MGENLKILKTMLHTWSDDEVTLAWGMIAEEGKRRRECRTADRRWTLKAGDEVTFNGRAGLETGTIVRVKRKKAIVKVGITNWDVPLAILTKA